MNLQDLILNIIAQNPESSSSQIHDKLNSKNSYSTTKRMLVRLIDKKLIDKTGSRKGTKYKLSNSYDILHSIDTQYYFEKDIDDRVIKNSFNFDLIEKDLYKAIVRAGNSPKLG